MSENSKTDKPLLAYIAKLSVKLLAFTAKGVRKRNITKPKSIYEANCEYSLDDGFWLVAGTERTVM